MTSVEKTYVDGLHEGFKHVINEIDSLEQQLKWGNYEISSQLIQLKNNLGIKVYKNWPQRY